MLFMNTVRYSWIGIPHVRTSCRCFPTVSQRQQPLHSPMPSTKRDYFIRTREILAKVKCDKQRQTTTRPMKYQIGVVDKKHARDKLTEHRMP
jgi:hypothetical protein